MIDFIHRVFYPAKIKQLERELAASKKATKYAVNHFCDLLGHKVTNGDVKEFLNNVRIFESDGND